MKTSRMVIARVITKKIAKVSPKQLSREVAAYLLEEGRVGELDSLLRDVMQQRADAGTVEADVVSAHDLNDAIRGDIRARVGALYPKADEIIINEQLDSDVVGGIKVELAHQQLDLSIRSKLNRFKQLTATGD